MGSAVRECHDAGIVHEACRRQGHGEGVAASATFRSTALRVRRSRFGAVTATLTPEQARPDTGGQSRVSPWHKGA